MQTNLNWLLLAVMRRTILSPQAKMAQMILLWTRLSIRYPIRCDLAGQMSVLNGSYVLAFLAFRTASCHELCTHLSIILKQHCVSTCEQFRNRNISIEYNQRWMDMLKIEWVFAYLKLNVMECKRWPRWMDKRMAIFASNGASRLATHRTEDEYVWRKCNVLANC